MKKLLSEIQETVQSILDAELEDIQRGGVACFAAPGQSTLDGFILGVQSCPIDLDECRIEIPDVFLKYFDEGK